jgi:hypothetical protein
MVIVDAEHDRRGKIISVNHTVKGVMEAAEAEGIPVVAPSP